MVEAPRVGASAITDEECDMHECEQCRGPLKLLGLLGDSMHHYTCRNCGWGQSIRLDEETLEEIAPGPGPAPTCRHGLGFNCTHCYPRKGS